MITVTCDPCMWKTGWRTRKVHRCTNPEPLYEKTLTGHTCNSSYHILHNTELGSLEWLNSNLTAAAVLFFFLVGVWSKIMSDSYTKLLYTVETGC